MADTLIRIGSSEIRLRSNFVCPTDNRRTCPPFQLPNLTPVTSHGPNNYQNIIDANGLTVRFLIVSPGPSEAPLSGTLLQNEAVLKMENLRYETLSYTWGNPVHKGPITINNRPPLSYRRKSLYGPPSAALPRQAPMHVVYQRAARVVVWLGPAFEDSDVAFLHLDMLWEDESLDGFVERVVSSGRATPSQVLNGSIWRPLATLFSTPW
ncbi:hypothetical protein B0T16DRAFT_460075 [Cercophora newfieldiana]|uniref:Heterokaryon incompatibility domain-containing protein n=1 Tax=Cercophora newfieldiana TaxID=92897 RepID=A0AA40CM26_9PEZI|nr:hypothetical protein B0T16DRAFT_460075 [Cercophora newfieldiana]